MTTGLATQLRSMGIRDERVLRAVAETPRRLFVPESWREDADADRPLPIGQGSYLKASTP